MNTNKFILIMFLSVFAAVLLTLNVSNLATAVASRQVVAKAVNVHVMQTTTTNSAITTNATMSTTNNSGWFGWTSSLTGPIVASVKLALAPYIGNPPVIPLSTFFTIGIATCMSLISSTAAKLLVDYDMVRTNMREFQAWQKQVNAARKAKDDQLLAKLTKKQAGMMKLQSRASMEQMKVTAVTFVPFLLVWYLMNAVFGPNIVAYAPFPLPYIGAHLQFYWWYLLCSFCINLPLMRIFGIGMSEN